MRYQVVTEFKTPLRHLVPAADGTDPLVLDASEIDGVLTPADWVERGHLLEVADAAPIEPVAESGTTDQHQDDHQV